MPQEINTNRGRKLSTENCTILDSSTILQKSGGRKLHAKLSEKSY